MHTPPRESIFRAALRIFCKLFFAICAVFLAIFVCSFVYSLSSGASLTEEKTTLTVLPNAEGSKEVVPFTAPAILQLSIHGVIGDPQSLNTEIVENILLESRTGMLKQDRVKGILLHFDTPGGTVVDSDNIYQMLLEYKKKYQVPVFGYVDGLCASGGMYIASSADHMFASPVSAIGSIGVVFGPFFNIAATLEKIGVQARTLTEGINKDMMNPTRPWREGEDSSLKEIMSYFYERFVDIVASARPHLDREKLLHLYGAQIYDCVKAQEIGYIDTAMSNRNAALSALLQAAKIDSAKPYQVVELVPRHNWITEFVKSKGSSLSGTIEHRFDLGQPKIQDRFAYLYRHDQTLHR